MSIILGVAAYAVAGCAAAFIVGRSCWWASGPHDEASEAQEQVIWLREHYSRGCNNDQGGWLTHGRRRSPE